nr:MAG TPA: Trimeric autotransporter adhesin, trimeric autotransporter adhesin, TAA [Caudoviricetes sp.]
MAKVCKQINRPTVNNDNNVCELLLSTRCVTSENPIPVLGTLSGENLTKIIDALNEYLKNLKTEIKDLEYTVRNGNGGGTPQAPSVPPYDWRNDTSLINFLTTKFNEKVDKQDGKRLTSEDYTVEDKRLVGEARQKLDTFNNLMQNIQSSLGTTVNKVAFLERLVEVLKNKLTEAERKAEKPITFRDKLGRTTEVKTGETFNLFGKLPNVKVEMEDKQANISLADKITLNEVNTGDVKMSSQGLDLGNKKVTNLGDGTISATSTDAISGKQINTIATELARQLMELETNTNTELARREKLSNKVDNLTSGDDENKYPNIKLIKQIKADIDSMISTLGLAGKEDKANKVSEINSPDPDDKYPNITLLKKVKSDLETVLNRHYTAIHDLQDQVNANDSAVHNAEINPTTAALTLKDKHGVTVGVLNLAFLNNEGTKFHVNETDKTLELKNDKDEVLSTIPLRTLVSNLANGLGLDGKKLKLLNSDGTEAASVDLTALFDLYTTKTKTQEVEDKLATVETQANANKRNVTSLTDKVTTLENEREKIANKVDDIDAVSSADEATKYPSVKALKKAVVALLPQEENTQTIEIQTPQIIGSIVRIELTHKVDDTKFWSVWINGVYVPRAAVSFTNNIMSIDNTKVGYNIEAGDELVVQYKVKKD